MKPISPALSGLALIFGTAHAHAAGIERNAPSTRLLFEPGAYGEVNLSYTDPDQRGTGAVLPPAFTGAPAPIAVPNETGNLLEDYWSLGLGWKNGISDRLSYAVILDQPFGASTDYEEGFYAGTRADLDSYQLSGILAYDVAPTVKIYGGLRAQRIEAEAAIPFAGPSAGLPPYTVETDTDWGYGWLAGAAFQRPEIALRLALTFYSEIDHEFETSEFGGIAIPGLQNGKTRAGFTTPRSANLDFQTGIPGNSLLFGSIRWVDWSEFAIAPPSYTALLGQPLVDYPEDWTTYTLGLGRQLTEDLSGALAVSYEPKVNEPLTTLGPNDGRKAGTLALSYDFGRAIVSGSATYGRLGDAENVLETAFDDGSFWHFGLRIGHRF